MSAPTQKIHELTREEYDTLAANVGDLEYDFFRACRPVPPEGHTWDLSEPALLEPFPIDFDPTRYMIVLSQVTSYKQDVRACAVDTLEDHTGEDVYVVQHNKATRTVEWKRRLKTNPGGSFEHYTEIEWINEQTVNHAGIQIGLATHDGFPSFETCGVNESNPDEPAHWDDPSGYPGAALYDWQRTQTDLLEDLELISFASVVSAAASERREKVLNKGYLIRVGLRKCLSDAVGNPLHVSIGTSDAAKGNTSYSAYKMRIHAVSARIPFVLKYTEKATYFRDMGPNPGGSVAFEEEREVEFNHTNGWEHEIEPTVLAGCETLIIDPHLICAFDMS